jgi:hypothetical protein
VFGQWRRIKNKGCGAWLRRILRFGTPGVNISALLMAQRIMRVFISVLLGICVLAGAVWLLSLALGIRESVYAGKTVDGWRQQLASHDAGASNQACETLNTQIVPRLVDQMLHDTNDSKLKLSLIKTLDGIPGVQVNFIEADYRRIGAAYDLGTFGPPAKAAVPFLIQALTGPNVGLREGSHHGLHDAAMEALGNIHSNPDVVIPLLIQYLANDNLRDEAAAALGNYGSLAREASSKIVPLLKANDNDTRANASAVLKQIDPEAAAKEGVK